MPVLTCMRNTTIGHYRIIELLGKGGMGEVYRAEDLKLQRQVALKLLPAGMGGDRDRRERFEREARAVAALNHPNIVTIYSVEEDAATLFLTLELVEGRTLDTLVPAGGLPLDRLLAYAIPLTDAVGAAHQRGIAHRDLKPANVMVTGDGRVKVLDFGLAKLMEDALVAQQAAMPTAELTGEGRIVGTIAYMSPEQAEGRAVDPRSDVFSLGILLHELATGERPFKGDTQVSLLSSILRDIPVSISDIRRDLPRDLARIVRRCLAKDPEDRYQTAKDLRNDLRALKQDVESGELAAVSAAVAGPARVRRRGSIGVAAAALAIVVVAGAAAYRWWPGSLPASTGSDAFRAVALSRLTTTGTAGLAAISDDGRYVAYVVEQEGQQGLWLRQVATSSNVQIVPQADARFSGVNFSPDGNHVYYAAYPRGENIGFLYQVPVLGGGSRRLLEDVDGLVSFAPDGSRFAFVRGYPELGETRVMIADADGRKERVLATRKRPLDYVLASAAWSPDGRTIAVPGRRLEQLKGEIALIDASSGEERLLGSMEWRGVRYLAWLPDGKALLVNAQEATGDESEQVWLVSYPTGEARRVTTDLSTYSGLSVAKDGKSFVSVRNELRSRIWTMPADSPAAARTITAGAGTDDGVQGLAWTPDGRIVYTSSASGHADIWIMAPDGSNRVQLTSTSGHETWPSVTADGRTIIFLAEREGNSVWRMDIDGGNQARLSEGRVLYRPTPSADGRWVYYTDSERRNYRVPIGGGPAEPVPGLGDASKGGDLPRGAHEPVPSPDGRWLTVHYLDPEQRGERIAIVPADGGEKPRLFPSVRVPARWSPDGRSLFYALAQRGGTNLWQQPIAGGAATQVTQFDSEQIYTYSLSPDQRHWALVRGDVSSDVVLVSDRP